MSLSVFSQTERKKMREYYYRINTAYVDSFIRYLKFESKIDSIVEAIKYISKNSEIKFEAIITLNFREPLKVKMDIKQETINETKIIKLNDNPIKIKQKWHHKSFYRTYRGKFKKYLQA